MRSIPARLLALVALAASSLALPGRAQADTDLQIVSVQAPAEATAGYPVTLQLTLRNAGTTATANYPLAVMLSPDPAISIFDRKLAELPGPALQPGESATVALTATLPAAKSASLPAGLVPGPYSLGVIVDPLNGLGELYTTLLDNVKGATPQTQVKVPSPDFAAVKLGWGTKSAAGEVVPVSVTIDNRGVLDGEALVSFFLSTNEQITNADQFVGQLRIAIPAGGTLDEVAWVKLPGNIAPARYYLGMWIDPADQVLELKEDNNKAVSAPADIAGASLGIETSYLPDALLGLPYVRTLVASGGDGPYAWKLTGGTLPEGLSLSEAGLLGGTCTTAGLFSPVVTVTSGNRQASAALILRCYAPTTALVVSTSELPPAILQSDYQVPLAAAGGTPPYTWRLVSGTLPDGLQLTLDGLLKGKPTKALAAPSKFMLEVRDVSGATNRRELSVRTIDPTQPAGALAIAQTTLDDAQAQQPYQARLEPAGGNGPFQWSLAQGRLPQGLALSRDQNAVLLSGKPLEVGTFEFTLRLEDSAGQADRNTFVLRVSPAALQVLTGVQSDLPDAVRGQPYDQQLTASADGSWRLVSGELPPGLALSADGHLLAEQIAATAPVRTYSFLVEVSDGQGGIGTAALSVRVPPPPEVDGAGGGGCAQTGGTSLLALALVALLLVRRRALPLLALAALLAPLAARAQTAPAAVSEYFVVTEPEETYPELTDAVVLDVGTDKDTGDAAIVLPFQFNLMGDLVTSARVGIDGYLAFSGDGKQWKNQKLPNSGQPNGVVAPWWDDLKLMDNPAAPAAPTSFIQWKVEGEAPTRVAIVEWHGLTQLSASSTGGRDYTFQARLYEAGGLSFHYKQGSATPPKFSATVGVENKAGTDGVLALGCLDTCDAPNYPAGQKVRFVRQTELVVTSVTAPAVAYANLPAAFALAVRNLGAVPADGVSARLYLSADKQLDPETDVPLWNVGPVALAKGEQKSFSAADVRIPLGTPPGVYYPIAVVDPDGLVDEANEKNDVLVGSPVRVGAPAPDFQVLGVQTDHETAAPGDTVQVTARLANAGNLEGTCHWAVVLSLNDVLSLADRVVGAGDVQLAPQDDRQVQATVTLPADLLPGNYRVGLIADADPDPAKQVAEIDEFNNALKADKNLLVSAPMAIVTDTLPHATLGAFYSVRLQNGGGGGLYLWSVAQGSKLPAGLSLSALGDLEGIPSQAGSTSFTVQLTASATQQVTKQLTLQVDPANLPLGLLTTQLPAAIYGRSYDARLTAQGGSAPYVFRLKLAADRSGLPAGLALDPNGELEGVPAASGDFPLSLEVEDHAGQKVLRDLTLHVLAPGRPVVDETPLPDALVNAAYEETLNALGGKAPYKWTLESVRRLADQTGDAGESLEAVPGLLFDQTGKLSGTPRELGLYALAVKVTDAAGAVDRDTVLLRVRAERGVAILTNQLPAATAGQPYDVLVVATGGDGALAFSLGDAAQALPAGIELQPDGHLHGTPTQPGRRSFVVRVTDDARRTDLRALTLEVLEAPVPDQGCQSAGPGGLLALVALALLLSRRRRALVAAALPLALALALLPGCGQSEQQKQPCDGVSCQPGETCDPADGVCKCGGVTGRACLEEEACNPSTFACELLDRCRLVECTRDMECDGADGTCKCGTQVCGDGQLCDQTAKRCVVADLCAQVSCAGGTGCDPADGVCKCGGAGGSQCGAGQVCDAGQCKADLCASVACTGGTVCDASDGRCHCGAAGGEQCLYGQTCVPTEKKCVTSQRCQAVRCAGGTSCDPADGTCKCGGAGGPTCQAGQTCAIETKECVGGNRCLNRTCPTGTECDPEDGQCHCGAQGPVCGADQACVTAASGKSCRALCDPLSQAPCRADESCVYSTTLRASLCGPAGTKAEGASCAGATDCQRGLACVTSGLSTVCRAYCPRAASGTTQCSPPVSGRTCKAFTGAPTDLGACMP